MDLNLTKKEVNNLGSNRYLFSKRRYWKAVWLLIGCTGIALLFDILTKNRLLETVGSAISSVIVIAGFIPFVVVIRNANKAGVKLADEWEKGIKDEQANN